MIIEWGIELTCLEAIVSVELVDIRALQPVPQQGQEVHQEEAPLETDKQVFKY